MTVHELLTGRRAPISNVEFNQWMAYLTVKAKREEQARKHAQR